ncbi:hypothetical protein [Granulicella sp. S156]|uniref:hypothetical protein n=1 Tax=Granulicella sp. S156 TaxID=1747224 RepID=UPI00131DA2E4|nr:hypothetical protein [Granulicella sp. S156]
MARSSSASRSKAQTGSGPAATLTQAQGMIQDYQQIMQPPVSNQMANAFFAVQRHPKHAKRTELVTVNPDNGLIWFYPDHSSNSGWSHEVSTIYDAPTDSNGPILPTALLPFYQRETLYVFAEYGNEPSNGVTTAQLLGMQWTESRGWAEASLPSPLRSILLQMTQASLFFDEDGMGYLYGVTYSFSNQATLVIVGVEPNGFELTTLYLGPAITGASYKLLSGTQNKQLIIMSLQCSTATFASAIKEAGSISLTGETSSQDLGVGDLTADTVVPIARGSAPQPSFLLLTQAQSLYLVVGNGLDGSPAATATQITGGTNQPAALISITGGSQEGGGAFTAFALDAASNSLWTLTQTSSGGSYAWVPMGNIGIAIAAPQFMAGGPEMFLCSEKTIVSHITQRASTGSWFTLPIATPSLDTQPITETASYSQQFTLTSTSTGMVMPREVLSIYSNPAQVLVINNIAYNSSPTSPAIVQTDPSGNLTVTSAATGLASPILSVTGAALTGTPANSYRGDLQLHQRIAGQGFIYNGQSLITGGVLPASASSDDSNELATNLQQLSGVAVNLGTGSSSSALKGARRSSLMQIREGKLHCRQITHEEYAAIAGTSESVFGDAWGGFAHFCKQAWNDITQIALEIAEKTATIAVSIYNSTKNFMLTTIDDIRDALEVILQWMAKLWNEIVNVLEKFIEFIKLLFDWDKTLNTKAVGDIECIGQRVWFHPVSGL